MSLAPAVHPDIHGVEGKARQVERICAAPNCISVSQQAHHLWSRSYLRGQPYDWVHLPSGRVVANTIGLCMRHHGMVTGGIGGHMAMIRLESDETFIWLAAESAVVEGGWVHEGLLHPQPWSATPVEIAPPAPVQPSPEHSHPNLEEGETCDSCGYTRPVKRMNMPKRDTKSYGILVPADAEVGSAVLDEWVESLAVILGFGDDVSQRLVRYHTIVAALAWTMQNRTQFMADIKEAAS